MAGVPIFTGRIDEAGELHLAAAEAVYRERWRKSLAGQDVEIIIRKKRTQRSLKQNAWIHVAASLLAEHCGMTLAEMKFELMGECWGWRTLPSQHLVPVKIHTSDMTVEEGTQFIDWLIHWSAEHFPEVNIPLPGQVAA